jgi:hypothetical protein
MSKMKQLSAQTVTESLAVGRRRIILQTMRII